MSVRTAEIAGGGLPGWPPPSPSRNAAGRLRVHERGVTLRTTGAGIYIYENGLRVLEAFGAYDEAVATAPLATTREVRDEANQVISSITGAPARACSPSCDSG